MDTNASNPSVTRWIDDLKRGEESAATALWQRYFDRLVRLAQAKLGPAHRRVADEEDVALSVFHCLCAGAARGRFPHDRDRRASNRQRTTAGKNRIAQSQACGPSFPHRITPKTKPARFREGNGPGFGLGFVKGWTSSDRAATRRFRRRRTLHRARAVGALREAASERAVDANRP